ncbi:SpoIIE family protein phosphatase [Streptomyces sp. NPDC055254]
MMRHLVTALRQYVELDLPPEEVLGLLDRVVGGLGGGSAVGCLYAVHDPETQRAVCQADDPLSTTRSVPTTAPAAGEAR